MNRTNWKPVEVRIRYVFFFQAEGGIRDVTVTGVQTCALPICDGAVLFDVYTATRVDVARDFAEGHHVAGVNFGSELGGGADGEFVTFKADGAVDNAVNLQVFGAGDLPLDLDAGAEACTTAGRDAAEFS